MYILVYVFTSKNRRFMTTQVHALYCTCIYKNTDFNVWCSRKYTCFKIIAFISGLYLMYAYSGGVRTHPYRDAINAVTSRHGYNEEVTKSWFANRVIACSGRHVGGNLKGRKPIQFLGEYNQLNIYFFCWRLLLWYVKIWFWDSSNLQEISSFLLQLAEICQGAIWY